MSLRTTAVRGGLYMALRQGLGIAVSTIGLILLTRILGPEAFGIWVAALGIYNYFLTLSGWGVDIYLIRQEGEPSAQDYHQAFTLLLLSGMAGTGLAFLALPLMGRWTGLEELGSSGAGLRLPQGGPNRTFGAIGPLPGSHTARLPRFECLGTGCWVVGIEASKLRLSLLFVGLSASFLLGNRTYPRHGQVWYRVCSCRVGLDAEYIGQPVDSGPVLRCRGGWTNRFGYSPGRSDSPHYSASHQADLASCVRSRTR
jgi:hypothetical protein